jgi:hypothetical protein
MPEADSGSTAGFDGMVVKMDWAARILGWFGEAGTAPLEFGETCDMAMTPDFKTVCVADSYSEKINKFVFQ